MPWWCVPDGRAAGGWLVARHPGAADEIRGLPALPDPQQALSVIIYGERSFFLAAAGSFPWAGQRT